LGTELMIEGLPPLFSNQQLNDLFSPVGTVCDALVITDAAGKSLRIGTVEMSTAQEAERAMQKLNQSYLQGELLVVFERVPNGRSTGQQKKAPS
jgi:RNA recognition motif-containing protein